MVNCPPYTDLEDRILKTLDIVDNRGYNLPIDKLGEDLIGGSVSPDIIKKMIMKIENIESDGTFVARSNMLRTEKCSSRISANGKYQPLAMRIAEEFSIQYVGLNPHVRCIMVTGSAASGGFCPEDDIDLNIVVGKGSKYSSYLLALMLGLKYSVKYRKTFSSKYVPGVPKVICINVVWEEHQVLPFTRQDEQVAFELLNSRVIYNCEFFNKMLNKNSWLSRYFPQIYDRSYEGHNHVLHKNKSNGETTRSSSSLIENLARRTVFSLYHLVKLGRAGTPDSRERMEYVEQVKHPYGIFNVPEKD